MSTNVYSKTGELFSWLFIGIWSYASVSKIARHDNFLSVLQSSHLFGEAALYISYAIPVMEAMIVLLIMFPVCRPIGLLISFISLLVLTGYLLYMVLFADSLPCSCGGLISSLTWMQHLLLNTILIILSAATILLHQKGTQLIAIQSQKFRPEQL